MDHTFIIKNIKPINLSSGNLVSLDTSSTSADWILNKNPITCYGATNPQCLNLIKFPISFFSNLYGSTNFQIYPIEVWNPDPISITYFPGGIQYINNSAQAYDITITTTNKFLEVELVINNQSSYNVSNYRLKVTSTRPGVLSSILLHPNDIISLLSTNKSINFTGTITLIPK